MTTDTRTKVQRNGQDTSWDAALLQTPEKSARLYGLIRYTLETFGPLTDEELLRKLERYYRYETFTDSGVRSRRNELVLSGWVTKARDDDGQVLKRQGANGSPRIVWRAVAEGEEVEVPTDNGQRVDQSDTRPRLGDEDAPEHAAGLAAAERTAAWNIGDASWARVIVEAYLDPEGVNRLLDEDGAPA